MDEANNRANNAEARLSRFKEVETRAKKLEAKLDSEAGKAMELTEKLAALEQENKVLRQGALIPSRSRISRAMNRQQSLENGEDGLEDGEESPTGELARKREKLVIDHTQLLADQEELLKVGAAGFLKDRWFCAGCQFLRPNNVLRAIHSGRCVLHHCNAGQLASFDPKARQG